MRLGLGLGLSRNSSFNPALLFGSSTAGAFYDPSDLSSMYQDSAGTTPAVVGQPVGLLRDKSGRGNHAVQATAAARPLLQQDSGGRYYLEFDGVDDSLRAAFAISQPWDRVSALRQTTWTANDRLFSGHTANAGNLYQASSTPNLKLLSGSFGPETAGPTIGANVVITERFNGASSRISTNAFGFATGDAGTTATDGIAIGYAPAAGAWGNFRLYGVLMIGRALTDGETQRVRSYMAGKAAVTL